jgi:hypothetical protein
LARNLASLSIDGYYQHQPINLLVAHHFTGFDYTFLRRRPMKPVKNLVFALLLVFALSGTTLAGEVPIPPAPPRATTTDTDNDTTTPLSDPYTEQSGDTVETTDYLLFEALTALIYLY